MDWKFLYFIYLVIINKSKIKHLVKGIYYKFDTIYWSSKK